MAARVNVAWQNWPGAPGVSVFFLNSATQPNIDAIRTFFDSIKALLPSGIAINVPGSGDVINEADGKIISSWSVATTPATVVGTGAGSYAGNSGMCVHWLSSGIVDGRRLRGRTFLVPIVSTNFGTNGAPSSTAITTVTTAANALVTALGLEFKVWSRPRKATSLKPARAGSSANVVGVRVPVLAISLRSRRV